MKKAEKEQGIRQFLTFTLEDTAYAIEIEKIREVLDYTPITKVPRMPDFLKGVINLRENVVPVIDLRRKLGLTPVRNLTETCVIITEVKIEGEECLMGALADSVQEVIGINISRISRPPRIGAKIKSEFLKGIGRLDEGFLIILNLEKVFSEQELAIVRDTGEASEEIISDLPSDRPEDRPSEGKQAEDSFRPFLDLETDDDYY